MTMTTTMTTTSRVFVLEPCSLDISRAARFGEIVYIFRKGMRRRSIWDDEFKQEVMGALDENEYDPKKDYLLVAGHMVPLVLFISAALRHYTGINVLFYCSTDRDYVSRSL